jgi:hypothetical protein
LVLSSALPFFFSPSIALFFLSLVNVPVGPRAITLVDFSEFP